MTTTKIFTSSLLRSSKRVTKLGVLMAMLGAAAIFLTALMGNITAMAIGSFLFTGGILRLTVAGASISWKTLAAGIYYSLIMITAGVWALFNTNMGLEELGIFLATYFVLDGNIQMYTALKLRPFRAGSPMLIAGLSSIVLGILMILKFPEASFYAVGLYLGVKLVIDGVLLARTGKAVTKFAHSSTASLEKIKNQLEDELIYLEAEEARVNQQREYEELVRAEMTSI